MTLKKKVAHILAHRHPLGPWKPKMLKNAIFELFYSMPMTSCPQSWLDYEVEIYQLGQNPHYNLFLFYFSDFVDNNRIY